MQLFSVIQKEHKAEMFLSSKTSVKINITHKVFCFKCMSLFQTSAITRYKIC